LNRDVGIMVADALLSRAVDLDADLN